MIMFAYLMLTVTCLRGGGDYDQFKVDYTYSAGGLSD